MSDNWYRDWFADPRYLELYQHRDELEANALVTLIENIAGIDNNRKILDVACGAGRHLIAFAQRGYHHLYGQDLSPTLINEARKEAGDCQIQFTVRDMRDPIPESYDLILNIFTSFGYFATDVENAHVIENCSRALLPQGNFVLDYLNTGYLRQHLVAHDEKKLPSGSAVRQDREIIDDRVVKRITFEDGKEFIESVRLYKREEIERMFSGAHLEIVGCFGSYTGDAYDELHSHRLIMIGKKQ